jgi:hypothetical protein
MNTSSSRGLRPNPHTLGVVPLKKGEASRPIRVRAKLEVFTELAKLNAAQIGQLLEQALTARNAQPAPIIHFTKTEAQALIGRTVRFLERVGPNEFKGRTVPIYAIHEAPTKNGYELELPSGYLIQKAKLGKVVELLEETP